MINYFKLILLMWICSLPCIADNYIIPTRDPFAPVNSFSQDINVGPQVSLKTAWISLYFAKANDVVSFISKKENHILSLNGQMSSDRLNNQIWLRDDVQHIAVIRAIIRHLDQATPQFLIKAKIINVDRQYQKSLGMLFRTEKRGAKASSTRQSNQPQLSNGVGEFTVTIAKFSENNLLNLQLSALEQQGHATLISSPALITLNNQPAVIESGTEVPYQKSTSSGATSVSFKKAALRLQVTPLCMPNHHILLHIALNQDKVSALTVHGVPAIETQQITTQVIVKNRETIVLGGILETTHAKEEQGVPIIDRIPGIGELFRHHTRQSNQQELLIFITPSMMRTL